jgi:hypothetical protein
MRKAGCIPVITATWEAKAGGIQVQSQLQETWRDPHLKKQQTNRQKPPE